MNGHLRQRSPGSYELRYSLGTDPATGRRKVATTTFRGSRKDAERELRRLLRTVDEGSHVDPNRLLMRDWLARWLDMVRPEISPVTADCYAEVVRLYLAPALGGCRLTKLGPAEIQALYRDLATRPRRDGKPGVLSPQSRRLVHRVLTAALNRAVELRLISNNPAQVLRKRLPKIERKEMVTLSPEQSQQLLDALDGSPYYWPTLLGLAAGLRRGEALGLKWRHVDLDRGTVLIAENLVRTRAVSRLTKAPKSGKTRTVT